MFQGVATRFGAIAHHYTRQSRIIRAYPLANVAKMHQNCGMDETLTDYLLKITGEKSARAIALKAGMDPSTLTRQLNSALRPDAVVDICRAYGLPVVPSLVFIGLITAEEAEAMSIESALEKATDLQLANELLRRVKVGTATAQLTEPMELDDQANVVPFRQAIDLNTVDLSQYAQAANTGEDRTPDDSDL